MCIRDREKGYWVDWQDLLLGTGITQNYEISMSGGTEKTSYSLSFGFQDDKGSVSYTHLWKRMKR